MTNDKYFYFESEQDHFAREPISLEMELFRLEEQFESLSIFPTEYYSQKEKIENKLCNYGVL